MENSLKGLMLAAGTIITCVIIGLGFFIAREAKDTANAGAGQISRLNAEFSESDKVMYDGMQISGSEVINVIKRFREEEISIRVQTKKNGTTDYNYSLSNGDKTLGGKSSNTLDAAKDLKDSKYINPNGQFIGSVIRDENNTILGISFVQR